MSCFSCISPRVKAERINMESERSSFCHSTSSSGDGYEKGTSKSDIAVNGKLNIAKTGGGGISFTFKELAIATKNFKEVNVIGEGGFGRVYKGKLPSGQIVAVKQLNQEGHQGNHEFIVEVLMLSLLHHPNLVTLCGYCTAGEQRLLVYEYMPMGSLEDHLYDLEVNQEPLDWNTRLKIATGAARGLEYLHCVANPPVIYRDLKAANILLDRDFNPKLSDFGLAKVGPVGDNTHVSTRVMGTYGYCAPEYAMTGKLTVSSDIYCFGVVLLELITGQKALDMTRVKGSQNLVAWARPFLKDPRKYSQLVDPGMRGRAPRRCLNYAIALTAMCLKEEAHLRPLITDIVKALEYLSVQSNGGATSASTTSPGAPEYHHGRRTDQSCHGIESTNV